MADVAGSKYPRYLGLHQLIDREVTLFIQSQYIFKVVSIGLEPHIDKNTTSFESKTFLGFHITKLEFLDLPVADDFLHYGIPKELHLRVGKGFLMEDSATAELVTAVNNYKPGSKSGKLKSFRYCRIPPADYCYPFVLEKGAIA